MSQISARKGVFWLTLVNLQNVGGVILRDNGTHIATAAFFFAEGFTDFNNSAPVHDLRALVPKLKVLGIVQCVGEGDADDGHYQPPRPSIAWGILGDDQSRIGRSGSEKEGNSSSERSQVHSAWTIPKRLN